MGEVTEMMLDGTLCQACGVAMDDRRSPGFPRTCQDCKADEVQTRHRGGTRKPNNRANCREGKKNER